MNQNDEKVITYRKQQTKEKLISIGIYLVIYTFLFLLVYGVVSLFRWLV